MYPVDNRNSTLLVDSPPPPTPQRNDTHSLFVTDLKFDKTNKPREKRKPASKLIFREGGGAVGVYPSKVNIQREITPFHPDKKNIVVVLEPRTI